MIKTWAVTDTGLVRKENQDTYRIARNGDICVVCDGMGGAAGGRLASTLASETYAAEMEKALKPDMTPEQLREASAYAVAVANRAVAERAEAEAALANMGTTLVAAVAYENGVVITNVGDSRAYYITEAGITRITKDHSLVETMVDHGDITAAIRGGTSSPALWAGIPTLPATGISALWSRGTLSCCAPTDW